MDELLNRLRNRDACSADEANRWMVEAADAIEKLAAWLQWCLGNCDDSPEYNFGTDATEHMRALLAGKDAPMP